MSYTCIAVYEDGVLRPLEPLPKGLLEEGEHLTGVINYETNQVTFYRTSVVEDTENSEVSQNGDSA